MSCQYPHWYLNFSLSAQKALIHLGKAYGLWKGDMRPYKTSYEDGEIHNPPPSDGTSATP
jgi:hypothetical protein